MKKTILAIAAIAALGLAACVDDRAQYDAKYAAEKALIESKLPAGCTFQDLGSYKYARINVVRCDGRATTSTNNEWDAGKAKAYSMTVEVSR